MVSWIVCLRSIVIVIIKKIINLPAFVGRSVLTVSYENNGPEMRTTPSKKYLVRGRVASPCRMLFLHSSPLPPNSWCLAAGVCIQPAGGDSPFPTLSLSSPSSSSSLLIPQDLRRARGESSGLRLVGLFVLRCFSLSNCSLLLWIGP
jgi:hypothetical protein